MTEGEVRAYYKNMGMALPYDVVKVIEEAIPDRERAEKVIRALEEGLGAVREEAKAQKEVVKAEIKEELTRELVTKADLAELKNELNLEIASVREDMARLEGEIRLVRVWLKVLAGIMLAGFTLFNPGFHQVLKTIIAHIGA